MWNLHTSAKVHSWTAHSGRVCGLAWSPLSTLACSANAGEEGMEGQSNTVSFASCSFDSRKWSMMMMMMIYRDGQVMGL